jgi:hypothetical protein
MSTLLSDASYGDVPPVVLGGTLLCFIRVYSSLLATMQASSVYNRQHTQAAMHNDDAGYIHWTEAPAAYWTTMKQCEACY